MILTDYFYPEYSPQWDILAACGVRKATVRLPETPDFDYSDRESVHAVFQKFRQSGFTPVIVEPIPNPIHDHIKTGDEKRDESIEKFIALLSVLGAEGIDCVCFNFMAHYGWTRTGEYADRAGSLVTGFELKKFSPDETAIDEERLWQNYFYFIKAVLPYAERYGVRLALHPDDPPLDKLGKVSRIFTTKENIVRGISTIKSDYLGVTFCQACYKLMGEDLEQTIVKLAEKIFFVHFRSVRGNKTDFRETFHDAGEIDMPKVMSAYVRAGINVPIRVDHVPTLKNESALTAGYGYLARLYAIGYMKGILQTLGACND